MNRCVYWVLGSCFGLGAALNLTLLFYPDEPFWMRYLAIGCVQGLVAGWLISSGNDAARRGRKAASETSAVECGETATGPERSSTSAD